MDRPYWSGMTVVILANVYTGSIIDKAILRIIGTVIGAWIGYFLAGLVVNSLLLYFLANFLLISLAVYYYNFSPHAYAYLLGALAAFFVISQLAISSEDAFYVAIWRSIEIGLGVLVSAAAALFIFPNNIQDNLIKDVNSIFDQINNLFDNLSKSLLDGEANFQEISAGSFQLRKTIKKSTEIIGFMRRELGIKRERIDQFRVFLDQFHSLSRTITYFISSYQQQNAENTIRLLAKPMAEVFSAAKHDLQVLKRAFFSAEGGQNNLEMEAKLANLQQEITNQSMKLNEEVLLVTPISDFLNVLSLLQRINSVIINLGNVLIHRQKPIRQEVKWITSQQQLRNDSDIIFSSIKTGLAAILALGFWLFTNWPNGLPGIVSSIVISLKKNLFEMSNISVHRLLGWMIGASVVLFPLAFFSLELYSFMLILFLSIWGFSYFSFKYIPYGYIGLQANIVIIIFMAQAGGPPTELEPAMERLAGIVIGIVSSFLVGNVLWRTDYFSILVRHLHKLYRFLIYNMSQLLQFEPSKARLYDLTGLFWLCRGLLEAFPESHFKGKKQQRIIHARKNFEQMVLIQAIIGHINDAIDRNGAHATAASYGVNLKELEDAVVGLYHADTEEEKIQLHQRLEENLGKFDLGIQYAKSPTNELTNCIAYINALNQLKFSQLAN
ncbi:FUSC family protein [Legionella micdadei]|uniref:FUSC family protein n=1 Tax=Legionella micdadei TaxID=451 RepID=UPI001E2E83B7